MFRLSPTIRRGPYSSTRSVFHFDRRWQHSSSHASLWGRNKNVRVLLRFSVITCGMGGIAYITDRYFFSSIGIRSVRAIYVMTWIGYQYSKNLDKYDDINELHKKTAEMMLNMLMQNKGIYIKLGQAIANQGELFPRVFQAVFKKLYDDAPSEEWLSVDKLLKANLGKNYETEIFTKIDHEPIASASIGQVHKAVLRNGDAVAVKVQHSYIQRQLPNDLYVYRMISRLYEWFFDLKLSLFTKFVSEQMITETDFDKELRNSERLRQLIRNDKANEFNIHIPVTYPEISTKQVLITEWCDGIPFSDKERLIANKVDLALLMKQFIGIFGRQIFDYGFLHADPHPGNLLVRLDSSGKQQVILLDHGLYASFDERFRITYSRLWKEVFNLNTSEIEKIAHSWGIHSVKFFTNMIRLSPVNQEVGQEEDFYSVMRNFVSDESKFPLELFFVIRSMRMIQTQNKNLGSPVNRINLLTNEMLLANRSFYLYDFRQFISFLQIKVILFFNNIAFLLIRLKQLLVNDKYGSKKQGIEDYLEVYMKQSLQPLGIELE